MTELLSERHPKANKKHWCDACEWIISTCEPLDFTFSERKILVQARKNNYKIQKGEKYTYQSLIYEGEFHVFKAITAIHLLCIKYDIYED